MFLLGSSSDWIYAHSTICSFRFVTAQLKLFAICGFSGFVFFIFVFFIQFFAIRNSDLICFGWNHFDIFSKWKKRSRRSRWDGSIQKFLLIGNRSNFLLYQCPRLSTEMIFSYNWNSSSLSHFFQVATYSSISLFHLFSWIKLSRFLQLR